MKTICVSSAVIEALNLGTSRQWVEDDQDYWKRGSLGKIEWKTWIQHRLEIRGGPDTRVGFE
jgi:hypothetical protein